MAQAKTEKQQPPDDGVIWRTRFRGTPVRIGMRDLTVGRMREAKALFGEQYGIPGQFLRLLLLGDLDAIVVAVWIGLQIAKKPVEIRELDFNLEDDFEVLEDPQPPVKEKGKKQVPPTKTPDGTGSTSPTSSEASFSSTSETSSA